MKPFLLEQIPRNTPRSYTAADTGKTYLSTPHREMFGYDARTEMLHPFGCTAYVHVRKEDRKDAKLSSRAKKGVFLGICSSRKGFKVLFVDTMTIGTYRHK